MEQHKQKLLNDLIEDGSMQAEERMLAAMLGNVKHRKKLRMGTRVCLSVIVLALVVSLWQISRTDSPSALYVDKAPSTIVSITESNTEIAIIETTADYVQYLPETPVDIKVIDDRDLEQIFSGQAYAIVDDPKSGGQRYFLLGTNGG